MEWEWDLACGVGTWILLFSIQGNIVGSMVSSYVNRGYMYKLSVASY